MAHRTNYTHNVLWKFGSAHKRAVEYVNQHTSQGTQTNMADIKQFSEPHSSYFSALHTERQATLYIQIFTYLKYTFFEGGGLVWFLAVLEQGMG